MNFDTLRFLMPRLWPDAVEILLVAFVLRIWNLNWDQGTHQHPDERYWSIITSEISAAETSSLSATGSSNVPSAVT